jgi:hypothetical protein
MLATSLKSPSFLQPKRRILAKSKKQLRVEYGLSKNMVARWIDMHLEKFEAIGYQRNQRILTPAQVSLFERIFGEPDGEDEL